MRNIRIPIQTKAIVAAGLMLGIGSITPAPAMASDTTHTMEFPAFTAIVASGNFQIDLQAQKAQSVEIIADDDTFKQVEAQVEGGTLYLSEKSNDSFSFFHRSETPHCVLTVPGLKSIKSSGACKIEAKALDGKDLTLDFTGTSKAVLNGTVKKLKVEMSGAGKLEAEGLKADDIDLRMSGAGKASVRADNHLKIVASGACKVDYWGNPTLEQDVSGVCSIKKHG